MADLVAIDSAGAAHDYGNLLRAGIDPSEAASVAEIGVLLAREAFRRPSDTAITCASLVGIGIQDLATVTVIRDKLW